MQDFNEKSSNFNEERLENFKFKETKTAFMDLNPIQSFFFLHAQT